MWFVPTSGSEKLATMLKLASVKPRLSTPIYYRPRLPQLSPLQYTAIYGGCNQISVNYLEDQEDVLSFTEDLLLSPSVSLVKG